MIVVRSNHDTATFYTFVWTTPLIKKATENDIEVIDIKQPNITKKEVSNRLKSTGKMLFFFNGHGTPSAMKEKDVELINCQDAHLLKDKVVFARSCDCLSALGPSAVQNGCLAFIGYQNKFWIPYKHGSTARPLSDPLAKPVLENSNIIVEELIAGKSVEQAIKKAREHAAENIVKILCSNDPWMSAALSSLIANDSSLGYLGNPSVSCF